MKLYARIENEKGKIEGLGGNEYLDIDITVGNYALCNFTLRHTDELPDEETSGWCLYDSNDEPVWWIYDNTLKKGKAKDDKRCTHGMPYNGKLCVICHPELREE